MPFKIIRNDITKVKADVIVNTANPEPVYGGGSDYAIYHAAGEEALLEERRKIGYIQRGEAAVTNAFNLEAKYIIHTVGPVWLGGEHNEFVILEKCYRNALDKALELECESIAFPLISTGVYGFPKDKALQIAIMVFSQFLMENEMQIILVVFDKKAFQLSGKIMGEIDSYIDANYAKEQGQSEYGRRGRLGSRREERLEPVTACVASMEEELENLGMSFHDKLFQLIGRTGMDNKDVWKLANLDRKHFSKIQCDANYHPKKKTVLALCIALRLDLEEAKDLLARADWAFSPSSKMDLIVQKAILDKQYNINQINAVLFQYTNEILGI